MKERSTGKLWLPLMAACLLMMGIFSLSVSTKAADNDSSAPEIPGLTFQSEMQNEFAECFHIYYYNDDYTLIDVPDSGQFLLVPEGKSAPDGLDEDIVVLQKPLDNIYLAATSAMSLFSSLDALDDIKFSSLQASGWYVDAAKQAMENGDIVFAGKYSEPDYELLVNSGCNLAIESTMILHTPKVQEMIEQMGIPVFTDRSSYENHPLGRTEWIKVYAEMVDKRDEAKEFFDEQAKIISDLKDFKNTEKTVAFFYINTDGSVVVRKPSDYVPKMIEIAGGRYVPTQVDSEEETKRSSVPMTMEEFYTQAIDADYLVYNGTIDDPINSVDELLQKSELFADFKAVKEGNVWCTEKNLFQETTGLGQMIADIHQMLTSEDDDLKELSYMHRLQ